MTSPNPQILVTQDDRILRVQFNRPERKNALSLTMYATLADIIHTANNDRGVRVMVLSGVNECFTSGNDLVDFMKEPDIHDSHPVVRFMVALQTFVKPVVALVQGYAVGIGTTLLLHCRFGLCRARCAFAITICKKARLLKQRSLLNLLGLQKVYIQMSAKNQ